MVGPGANDQIGLQQDGGAGGGFSVGSAVLNVLVEQIHCRAPDVCHRLVNGRQGGWKYAAWGVLSKPTGAMSCGTRLPRRAAAVNAP